MSKEVLSQEEIDNLLKAISTGDIDTEDENTDKNFDHIDEVFKTKCPICGGRLREILGLSMGCIDCKYRASKEAHPLIAETIMIAQELINEVLYMTREPTVGWFKRAKKWLRRE